MPFADSKLIYANTLYTFKRRRGIMIFKMAGMYLFDGIPRYAQ